MNVIKSVHWIIAVLIVLLGAVHTGMGFYCMELNENTLWFIGSGIALMSGGLFNFLQILTYSRPVWIVTLVVNVVNAGLFLLATQVIAGPHVYFGLALFVLAAFLTFAKKPLPANPTSPFPSR